MNLIKSLLLLAYLTIAANAIVVDKQITCLALNIYYEARSSNLADQAGVTNVVLNRVESSSYPNTICEVVKQGKISQWHLATRGKIVPIKNQCQFSWFCDLKSDIPLDIDAWEKAKLLAFQIYNYNLFRGLTEGATHYFAAYIKPPSWAKNMQLVGRIGAHLYYKNIKDIENDINFTGSYILSN